MSGFTDYKTAVDSRDLAGLMTEPGRTVPYRVGQVSAVDFAHYPPTIVLGEGDQARRMRFLGHLSGYHPGQAVAFIEQPGAPLVLGPLPLTGVGDNYLETDPLVGLPVITRVGAAGSPSFASGWANYNTVYPGDANLPYETLGYYMQPDYWVRLSGLIARADAAGAPRDIFTLPPDYRPPVDMSFCCYSSAGGAGAGAWVKVRADGVVRWEQGGASNWMSLSGITFPSRWNRSAWVSPAYQSGWSYDVTEGEGGIVEYFVRDDGWTYLKGVLVGNGTGAGVGTRAVEIPAEARVKRYAQMVPGTGFGVASYEVHHIGALRNRGGYDSKNVIGGVHWFSSISEQVAWQNPAYTNLWVDYGGGWERGGYYLDHMGVVHMRGLIKGGLGDIFVLPPGYRPLVRQLFMVVGASSSADVYGRIDVTPDGRVIPQGGVGGSTNSYLSLNNISFRAEQ